MDGRDVNTERRRVARALPQSLVLTLALSALAGCQPYTPPRAGLFQRLAEIHQHKGNSECYAGDAAPDPTCNFEHVPEAGLSICAAPALTIRKRRASVSGREEAL